MTGPTPKIPDRREIAEDLFRDHIDLTRMTRAMALARAARGEAAEGPRKPPAAG